MRKFDQDNLQRILDYRLNLDEPQDRQSTEQLLQQDPQARQLDEAVGRMLQPLGSWQDQASPGDLTDRTLDFIKHHQQAQVMAQASAALAGRRLEESSGKTAGPSRWRWVMGNMRDIISVAACLLLVFTLARPALDHSRQVARQQQCASQMQQAGIGFSQYAQANNGFLPYVPRPTGAPWWLVGQQGEDNVSNTRNAWLLVQQGYLPPSAFMCPGAPALHVQVLQQTDGQVRIMKDFWAREAVSYSLRLHDPQRRQLRLESNGRDPLMADKNPLFATFNAQQQRVLDMSQNGRLYQMNSPNHAGEGQNVLYHDGSAGFTEGRFLGTDDIYTIRDARQYHGTELPASDDDIFIAP